MVYRCYDHYETVVLHKALIDNIANFGGGLPPGTSGLMLSKRNRDGDERYCQIRML